MADNQDRLLQELSPESEPETRHDDIDFQPRDDDFVEIVEPIQPSKKDRATNERLPAKPPVPASIKMGLALAAFVVIAIGAAGVFYVSSKTKLTASENSTLPTISPFEIGGAINIQDKNVTEASQSTPVTVADEATVIESATKKSVDVDVDSLEARYSALVDDNAKLNTRIDEVVFAFANRDQSIDALRADIVSLTDGRIPALQAADRAINGALDTLRLSTDKIERRALEEARHKAESPPFIVSSIDEWGATASAVLKINGRPTAASVGDVYSGWKITRIVWPDCLYAVRDSEPNSAVVKVCGAGKL